MRLSWHIKRGGQIGDHPQLGVKQLLTKIEHLIKSFKAISTIQKGPLGIIKEGRVQIGAH